MGEKQACQTQRRRVACLTSESVLPAGERRINERAESNQGWQRIYNVLCSETHDSKATKADTKAAPL